MEKTMSDRSWVDRSEYPFASHYIDVDGGRMHYVDEGEGEPVVMVHGTPTWSFLYRRFIRELARTHRVIAPDNIGFGLSEKPERWGYRPEDHARNLASLIERLGLRDVTLVVHDFGGPIGLSYAVEHPENVKRLVIFNTWMWSLAGQKNVERASRLLGGILGKLLYLRMNFSPKVLLKSAFADKSKLTPATHRHYIAPFGSAAERVGPWTLAKELIGSSAWYARLWERRDRIASKPTLILWGMKDPTFGPDYLEQCRKLFTNANVVEIADAGHFVQEELEEAPRIVGEFLTAYEKVI